MKMEQRLELQLAQEDRHYRNATVYEKFIELPDGSWIKAVNLYNGEDMVTEWHQFLELAEAQRVAFKRATIVQFSREPYRFEEAR